MQDTQIVLSQKCLQTSSKTAGVVFTCCYMLGPIDFLTFFVVVVFLFVCLFKINYRRSLEWSHSKTIVKARQNNIGEENVGRAWS